MSALYFRSGSLTTAAVVGAVVLACVTGVVFGLGLALLTFAGCVLLGVIALFWSSVRNLSGETPLSLDEALGLGAPTAAEEQKRSVLRALKDLEFERSLGKISEQDYLEFAARYRAEAKRLIAAVDETLAPTQMLAAELAKERLAEAGLEGNDGGNAGLPTSASLATDTEEATSAVDASKPSGRSQRLACGACATDNEPDARFCKKCGIALLAALDEAGPSTHESPKETTP